MDFSFSLSYLVLKILILPMNLQYSISTNHKIGILEGQNFTVFQLTDAQLYSADIWHCLGLCILSNLFFKTLAKGQLISKCTDEKSVSSKIPMKIFLEFCPDFFCSFMGASWKLFGASYRLPYLWYYQVPRKPKKLQGTLQEATKNFRAEIQK